MKMIGPFTGKYRFLSNFYPSKVVLDGVTYPTVEHAFQAAKTLSIKDRKMISRRDSPTAAKRAGREVVLRRDWETKKLPIMKRLLRQKFALGTDLAQRLLDTEDWTLVEVNTWHDKFWGVCDGEGKNHLGKLLMKIRGELRKKIQKRRPE